MPAILPLDLCLRVMPSRSLPRRLPFFRRPRYKRLADGVASVNPNKRNVNRVRAFSHRFGTSQSLETIKKKIRFIRVCSHFYHAFGFLSLSTKNVRRIGLRRLSTTVKRKLQKRGILDQSTEFNINL